MRNVSWVVAAFLAVGCAPQPTRIVVVSDSDLVAPADVDSVRFVIDARAIGGEVQQREIAIDGARVQFPLVLAVVHEGGALGPVTIEAVALRRGEARVSRTARLSFVAGRSVVLALDLRGSCIARSCDLGASCVDGACVPIDVDASLLPDWTGRGDPQWVPMPMPGSDAGPPPPIDGGPPPIDATVPPPPIDAGGCLATQSCDESCMCSAGCACGLTCAPGGDCDRVVCSGAGSECTLVARGASNYTAECRMGAHCVLDAYGASNVHELKCRDGASCEADCRETSNCTLKCESGASCLLQCDDDDDNCRLDCRDDARVDCGDGRFACRRACP